MKIYWVRRSESGIVTAALLESHYKGRDVALLKELRTMAGVGPVDRLKLNICVVGQVMKEIESRPKQDDL